MKVTPTNTSVTQEILHRKETELLGDLRNRTGLAIETSPDQMDEIQVASERDLAIRNVDHESGLLAQVRAALRRIRDGGFGVCVDCELPISAKRLAVVPWAARCVQCQEESDREGLSRSDSGSETFAGAGW